MVLHDANRLARGRLFGSLAQVGPMSYGFRSIRLAGVAFDACRASGADGSGDQPGPRPTLVSYGVRLARSGATATRSLRTKGSPRPREGVRPLPVRAVGDCPACRRAEPMSRSPWAIQPKAVSGVYRTCVTPLRRPR